MESHKFKGCRNEIPLTTVKYILSYG